MGNSNNEFVSNSVNDKRIMSVYGSIRFSTVTDAWKCNNRPLAVTSQLQLLSAMLEGKVKV